MKVLIRIFHEARCARREKCSETVHPWPVSLSPTVCVGPVVPTQTVGSKFLRYASEFASASVHLLARTLHVRAIFGLSRRAVVGVVHRAYKMCLSPLFGNACRFHPSCSDYAREAVSQHGWLCGGWLALRRLTRCHPWNPGGVDEVPK